MHIATTTSSNSELACLCASAKSQVSVNEGRPDIRAVIERNLRAARGETGLAVCGPRELMAKTRNIVAALSDERGAGKGTGAYGVELFGEGFGW